MPDTRIDKAVECPVPADAGLTDTVVECVALPPAPEQVIVYVSPVVSAPVDREPLVSSAPVHPPDAVHVLALAALQLRTALAPEAIAAGDALSDTVGIGAAVIVAPDELLLDPPEPEELPPEPEELPPELLELPELEELPEAPLEELLEEPELPEDEPLLDEPEMPVASLTAVVAVVPVVPAVVVVPAPDAVVVLAPTALDSCVPVTGD